MSLNMTLPERMDNDQNSIKNFRVFRKGPFRSHIYQAKFLNRLTPNDPYVGRTAPLTSKRCILYIYSTNIGTEYFKHALYSPFFSLQNAVCFIMLICLVPVLFAFYIQNVLKLKKNNSGAKGLTIRWCLKIQAYLKKQTNKQK